MHSPKAHHSERKKGLGPLLAKYRRPLIVVGALISLVSYFVKDGVRERTKDKATAASAGSVAYLASMPELRAQLSDLFTAEQLLKSDPSSTARTNLLLLIGNLTLRAQTNTLQLSAFLKTVPDALLTQGPVVSEIMKQTDQVALAGKDFLAHPPADGGAFQTAATSLVQRFTSLENAVGKTGSELKIFATDDAEKLERASSRYGAIITVLYVFSLGLTSVAGLYGIEVSKNE